MIIPNKDKKLVSVKEFDSLFLEWLNIRDKLKLSKSRSIFHLGITTILKYHNKKYAERHTRSILLNCSPESVIKSNLIGTLSGNDIDVSVIENEVFFSDVQLDRPVIKDKEGIRYFNRHDEF